MRRIRSVSLFFSPLLLQLPAEAAAESSPLLSNIENPRLPTIPGARTSSTQTAGQTSTSTLRAFMMDAQKLSVPIDTTTVTEADNERIDREVAAYKALADRLTDGRYDATPLTQREPMLTGLRNLYDGAAASVDQEIAAVQGIITGRGKADAAYNSLIAMDAYLYSAEKLFRSVQSYPIARSKVSKAISNMGGSRAGARASEDSAELAKAKLVYMPAAVTRDKATQALFRQAWDTSGIPWQIMRINITSGWRDKLENGRVIGQRRDAAIAARDPNNPNRCNLYDFTMFRDRSGAVRRDSHSTTRIACENVK
ncbi:MAG: hypothetical protein AAGB23_07635 [Pseudomonadota bacterium]